MNTFTRRFVRPVLLNVIAMGLAACHFHGGYGGGWGHHGHGHYAPIRHCR